MKLETKASIMATLVTAATGYGVRHFQSDWFWMWTIVTFYGLSMFGVGVWLGLKLGMRVFMTKISNIVLERKSSNG